MRPRARRGAASPHRRGCPGARGIRTSDSRRPERSRGRADRNAIRAADALDVRDAAKRRMQRAIRPLARFAAERATASWRAATTARSRSGWCNQCRSSRLPMPVAHRVEQRHSVGAGVAAERLGELEVAAGRRVHPRGSVRRAPTRAQRRDASACACVRRAYVEQRAGGGDRRTQVLAAEAREPGDAEVLREETRSRRRARTARRGSRVTAQTPSGSPEPSPSATRSSAGPIRSQLVGELAHRRLRRRGTRRSRG